MQKRRLGNANLEVSALGFGCMNMRQSYGVEPDAAVIRAAVERGRTLVDTAAVYGMLTNYELAGEKGQ